MKLFRGFKNIRGVLRNPVVTIGSFDGVHKGHQKIIKTAVDTAKKIEGTSVVITFDRRPITVFSPGICHDMIMPLEDKIQKLSDLGVDVVILVRFNRKFASIDAERFIDKILCRKLKIIQLVVGKNFRFGKSRKGDVSLFRQLSNRYGFKVKVVSEEKYRGEVISSTKIRGFLKSGSITLAQSLLGHTYSILGTVIRGSGRGRVLGIPTANVACDNKRVVPKGVYAVRLQLKDKEYEGVCNVGDRPTFEQRDSKNTTKRCTYVIEVHLFGLSGYMYGRKVHVIFIKKIRDEKRFKNSGNLVLQIRKDIVQSLNILRTKRALQN
ncbi:MAG: bifunctional riboflavin kinase/FAD synthetase [bacterium]